MICGDSGKNKGVTNLQEILQMGMWILMWQASELNIVVYELHHILFKLKSTAKFQSMSDRGNISFK